MSRVIVTPLLLLYSPLGLILVLIRSLLLIYVFLASAILYNVSPIKRVVLRLMCSFLGFFVTTDGVARGSNYQPYVSNCATIFDHMVLSLLTNCVTPHKFMFSWALNWRQLNYDDTDAADRLYDVFHLQPEETPAGPHLPYLLRFNNAPFRLFNSVQPVAISVSTGLPIHFSVHPIDWKYEIFWLLFLPIVRVHVSFLDPMAKDTKSDEAFSDSVRQEIAKHLHKKVVDWDESKLISESEEPAIKSLPPQHKAADAVIEAVPDVLEDTNCSNKHHQFHQTSASDPRIEQVLAVIPDSSPSTVETLLGRLGDVDLVIARLLERPPSPSPPGTGTGGKYVSPGSLRLAADSFSRLTEERHRSFASRKALFLENARQRYLEVHRGTSVHPPVSS